jgi:phage terminase large subunit
MAVEATEVFQKNWEAIQLMEPDPEHPGKMRRKYRYIINKGSSRSSKTISLLQIEYLLALKMDNKRLTVWRDTKKDCKDTVGYDMKKVYPSMPSAHLVNYNKSDSVYMFPRGSVLEICGTDEPNRLHGYNGDVTWLNEPYSMSKDTFDQLDMRTSELMLIDLNPKENHWSDDLQKNPRTLVIHSTFKDNPYCPKEQKVKILSYQPVEMCALVVEKLLKLGDAFTYDILKNPKNFVPKYLKELSRCMQNERQKTASKFNWVVYGLGLKADRTNRIFSSWQQCTNEEYESVKAKKYYGVDWGEVDPWGMLEAKYYDGTLYLHELNYASETMIKQRMSYVELEKINKMPEGLVRFIFDSFGVSKGANIICDDNRAMKVVALREGGYYMAQTAAKGPGSILEGINLLNKLRVKYTASSRNIDAEVDNYVWKMWNGAMLEEAEDHSNHLCDPARYIALFLRQQGVIRVI